MLTLPSQTAGRSVMLDPAVQDFVDLLHNGYAPFGWEGDERLGLYLGPENRWELWRLCEDEEMRLIVRSKPDAKLDVRVIQMLVEHDARRGHDAAEEVIAHNEALVERRTQEAVEALMEPMDKVMWGIRRDLGHLY